MSMDIGQMLADSFRYLDEKRNQRAIEQAQEREWPSVVLEDILDAEEVTEREYFRPNPLIFGGMS